MNLSQDSRTKLREIVDYRKAGSAGQQNCIDEFTAKTLVGILAQHPSVGVSESELKDAPITSLIEIIYKLQVLAN